MRKYQQHACNGNSGAQIDCDDDAVRSGGRVNAERRLSMIWSEHLIAAVFSRLE